MKLGGSLSHPGFLRKCLARVSTGRHTQYQCDSGQGEWFPIPGFTGEPWTEARCEELPCAEKGESVLTLAQVSKGWTFLHKEVPVET